MNKTTIELLEEVNSNYKNITQYVNNQLVLSIIKYGVNPDNKFMLPEGIPPYKKGNVPPGMGYSSLFFERKKFYVFNKADLKPAKREEIFINILESLDDVDIDILILIKDQKLNKRFPNITYKKMKPLLDIIPANFV